MQVFNFGSDGDDAESDEDNPRDVEDVKKRM